MKDWHRGRRDLLQRLGLGAAALPLLRATGARAQLRPRLKLICILGIHGYRQTYWRPAVGPLADQTLPSSTSPLDPHKSDLLFVTKLAGVGGGDAAYGTTFWGQPDVVGGGQYKEPNGKTLDQVVASAEPPPAGGISSLAFGVQLDLPPRTSTMPGASMCFWRGAGMPVKPESDPGAIYGQLFPTASPNDPTAINQLLVRRKSVLDYVGRSLQRFAGRVGSADRDHVLAHLEAVRALERRIPPRGTGQQCQNPPPVVDLTSSSSYPLVLAAELDVMLAALSCGVTRVATLQLADALGMSINFGAFVPGLPAISANNYKTPYRNWIDLANSPIQNGQDHKRIVDQWWMTRFAELIARMKALPDVDGTSLFDNSIVVWANPVEEGAAKNARAQPWVIAAKNGVLKSGQHVDAAGRPSAGVIAAICTAMGVPGEPFGKPMPELLA